MSAYLSWGSAIFTFMVFCAVFFVGEQVSNLTKGIFGTGFVGAILFIALYWTGIMPTDAVANTGLVAMLSKLLIPMLIVNLGTMISLNDMLKEWKTILTALAGFVTLALFAYTLGIMLLGREYALVGACPISGGTIAGVIAQETCEAAGRPELGAYAMLLVSLQGLVAMPCAAACLRMVGSKLIKEKADLDHLGGESKVNINIRVIKTWPAKFQSYFFGLMRIAAVAVVGNVLSGVTGGKLNVNIAYLIVGILFTELGFLDKQHLTKANAYGFVMVSLFSLTANSMGALTPDSLKEMLLPIAAMLIFGIISLGIGGAIVGKIFGYELPLGFAIGACAMLGYPSTQIVTDDVCKALECSEEEKEKIRNYLLPKMLVAGFTTVTIASVAFAGIVAPTIFK